MSAFFGSALPARDIWEATLRSLALSSCVAAFSGMLGIALAWLVTRAEIRGRTLLAKLLTVPYALPAYLLGMAWVVLGNPGVGLFRSFLPASGSYGFWGMVWVESSVAFAFPFLELKAGFEKLDPALEEAARMSGAAPARVFFSVSLPLLWPALLNGMCLAFLYTVSSFGVPAILGLPVRQFVLTTLIYSELKVGGAEGLLLALRLSVLLLIIAVVVLLLSAYLGRLQRKRGGAIAGGKSSRPSQVRLGAWTFPAMAAAWLFWVVAVALPWGALGMCALAPIAGQFSPSLWTLRNLRYVLTLSDFHEGFWNSLVLTIVVSSGLAAIGFVLGFIAVRRNKKWASWLIHLTGIFFATPGSVLALIIILFSAWMGGIGPALFWIGLAYALKYVAVPARLMLAAFAQVHPSLEEAARMSGASTPELLRTIWMPLLKGALAAGWFLSALPIFSELTMSVLLTGPGASTLGTVLFQLQEYADQPSAAALAWLLLSAALAVALIRSLRAKLEATA